jgi:hypothetical protein
MRTSSSVSAAPDDGANPEVSQHRLGAHGRFIDAAVKNGESPVAEATGLCVKTRGWAQ